MPQILQFAVKGGIFYIKTKKNFPMNNFKRKKSKITEFGPMPLKNKTLYR